MIKGGWPLIAEQPGNLRERDAGLLDVLQRQTVSQTVDDLFVACVLLTQFLRERSLGQPQRLGDPLSVGFAVRQQFLQFVLD